MSKGKLRLSKPERRHDCVRYDDCLMDAALANIRNFTCHGCSLYEKGAERCNNRPPQRVYVPVSFFDTSHNPDINWMLRKNMLSHQRKMEM